MFIENHQFDFSISALTDIDLEELITLLGIPDNQYKHNNHHETKTLMSMEYGFGTAKRSVFIMLGKHKPQYLMEQNTRAIVEYTCHVPKGYERYRPRVSVELHGSFFDNSPDFNLSRLLKFLERTGYNPKALDIAYCDDQHRTKITDWLRVFRKYSNHCLGNIVLKGKIYPVEPNGLFQQVNIGNAGTKTGAYGTLYQRPDYIRLEIKYRGSDFIRMELLSRYDDQDREPYFKAALSALITNLDIVTATSKKARDPVKYIREPFFQRFLDSEPARVSLKELKEAMQASNNESRESKLTRKAKRLAGAWNNLARELTDLTSLDELRVAINMFTSPKMFNATLLP
jgi:hypothetical protein